MEKCGIIQKNGVCQACGVDADVFMVAFVDGRHRLGWIITEPFDQRLILFAIQSKVAKVIRDEHDGLVSVLTAAGLSPEPIIDPRFAESGIAFSGGEIVLSIRYDYINGNVTYRVKHADLDYACNLAEFEEHAWMLASEAAGKKSTAEEPVAKPVDEPVDKPVMADDAPAKPGQLAEILAMQRRIKLIHEQLAKLG